MISGKNRSNVILLSLLTLALLPALCLSLPIRASSPTLLISEVLYDATGPEPDEEWIKIYNAGASAIDLSDYKVGDEEEQGGTEGMQQFPVGASINPGQVIVIANKATAFFGVWGFNPDYEMVASDEAVPDMIPYTYAYQHTTTDRHAHHHTNADGDNIQGLPARGAQVVRLTLRGEQWIRRICESR